MWCRLVRFLGVLALSLLLSHPNRNLLLVYCWVTNIEKKKLTSVLYPNFCCSRRSLCRFSAASSTRTYTYTHGIRHYTITLPYP
ncbi:hypothetical protein BDF14DRAFT_1824698 [Spinellus fusiger]|nr:hypothetical protein BDF14DRAFT_1824698 [Spinellus fusiger]